MWCWWHVDWCLPRRKKKKHASTSNPVPCSKRQSLQSETPAGRPNELPARLALSEGCHGWLRITEMVSINCQTNISKLVFKAFSWHVLTPDPWEKWILSSRFFLEGWRFLSTFWQEKNVCVPFIIEIVCSNQTGMVSRRSAWKVHKFAPVDLSYKTSAGKHPSQLGVFGDQCSLIFSACHVLVHHHHHHHHRKNCTSLETKSSGAAIVSWWRLLMRKAQVLRRNW